MANKLSHPDPSSPGGKRSSVAGEQALPPIISSGAYHDRLSRRQEAPQYESKHAQYSYRAVLHDVDDQRHRQRTPHMNQDLEVLAIHRSTQAFAHRISQQRYVQVSLAIHPECDTQRISQRLHVCESSAIKILDFRPPSYEQLKDRKNSGNLRLLQQDFGYSYLIRTGGRPPRQIPTNTPIPTNNPGLE